MEIAHASVVPVPRVRPATLFGSGKVAEIGEIIAELGAGVVVVDGSLTPIQQRNLERAWDCKVIDRTGLILEIFGARARSREGKLQVELAALMFFCGRHIGVGGAVSTVEHVPGYQFDLGGSVALSRHKTWP